MAKGFQAYPSQNGGNPPLPHRERFSCSPTAFESILVGRDPEIHSTAADSCPPASALLSLLSCPTPSLGKDLQAQATQPPPHPPPTSATTKRVAAASTAAPARCTARTATAASRPPWPRLTYRSAPKWRTAQRGPTPLQRRLSSRRPRVL